MTGINADVSEITFTVPIVMSYKYSCYKNVTPAQAGVQFKDAWIPAFAGMTDREHDKKLNHII